tara:strand:- start:1821 stop:3080 length:1260 start_codon:yes stop_codon:yes gene_type:complete
MKLEIENWIISKHYSTNVKRLFSESVICYRNEAYRASLLFSYIGFLTIIKQVLINSKRPSNFTEPEWTSQIKKINDDELWEKEVYEMLIRTKKPIFQLRDDLRLQLKYWKDRRNDCAHFKSNEIESHHTESFWSFMKSNIQKMTVEGGKESLLNKFDDHFDDTKTPPNKDFSYLVKEIASSVSTTDYDDFFRELKSRINGKRWWYGASDTYNVFAKILDISEPEIQEALIEFLKKENRDIHLINAHPNKISRFNYSNKDIRSIWKTKLSSKSMNMNPLRIYSALLRESLIPKGEIEEGNEALFEYYEQTNNRFLPESIDIDTLKANGFFQTIRRIAIHENGLKKFMWVNSKCDLIISFIENEQLTKEVVESISKMAVNSNPSQWLVRELISTFSKIPEKKKEFQSIANTNGISLPHEFK